MQDERRRNMYNSTRHQNAYENNIERPQKRKKRERERESFVSSERSFIRERMSHPHPLHPGA